MTWQTPKTDWIEDDYYNAEDLNRVENNTIEVANLIKQVLGLDVGLNATVTNRDYSRIEFADSLNRIESNIEKLSVIAENKLKTMKTTWAVGDPFSYKDAIRLEYNLPILYDILSKNFSTAPYCGEFICGEDVI